tara:strand:- start:5058 stop:6032 length:975 start_codon:yes stop_codon:yes gene_type:complete
MGKLRKIGRKIKKGVKKLFKSKIGKIVGMVGLYFAMGAAMKGLSNWFNSSFGKAGATAAESTAVAAESTVGASGGFGTQSGTLATGQGGGGTIGNIVEGAATNSEATNAVIAGVDSAAINGTTTANSTITEAVTNVTDSGILDTPVTEVKDSLNFLNETKGNVMDVKTAQFTPPEVTIDTSAATDLMNTRPDIAMDINPTVNVPDAALESPSRLEALATNTREGVSNLGENIGTYFREGDVIPDTIAGVGTGLVMSQFQDEPEMGGGFIAPQPIQVQAQGAYMQEVGPMMASVTGVPNFSNFTQMANQSVYGIGTPNHLAGLYG